MGGLSIVQGRSVPTARNATVRGRYGCFAGGRTGHRSERMTAFGREASIADHVTPNRICPRRLGRRFDFPDIRFYCRDLQSKAVIGNAVLCGPSAGLQGDPLLD